MITDLEVKRAMNRLGAVYPLPKNRDGAFEEWRKALRSKSLDVKPAELEAAVSEYIAKTEKSYGFPIPASIITLIQANRAQYYREPDYDGPVATPEDIRRAWSEHVDLDELKRLNRARRGR